MVVASITAALTGLSLGLKPAESLVNLGKKAADGIEQSTSSDVGRVYYKIRALMENRTILGIETCLEEKYDNKEFVKSPAVTAFCNLFGPARNPSGVVYVLHDKEGNGKSTAGMALLTEWYQLGNDNKKIKGFMLKGDAVGDNIAKALMEELDCEKVNGWINILLHALNEPDEEAPSILILDGVNSLGEENINWKVIKALYDRMDGKKNIFVVVICQDAKVATEICGMNNGMRVVPMPGFYKGEKTSPQWVNTSWTRSQLLEMVKAEYSGKFTEEQLAFVQDGMTPMAVLLEARIALRCCHAAPESPRKKQRTGSIDTFLLPRHRHTQTPSKMS